VSSSIPLTNAVTSGDEQAVSALLANGADVNETTGGGQTALILAVIFGRTNLVKLLMKAGADPQLRDNLGLNAIETSGGDAGLIAGLLEWFASHPVHTHKAR